MSGMGSLRSDWRVRNYWEDLITMRDRLLQYGVDARLRKIADEWELYSANLCASWLVLNDDTWARFLEWEELS